MSRVLGRGHLFLSMLPYTSEVAVPALSWGEQANPQPPQPGSVLLCSWLRGATAFLSIAACKGGGQISKFAQVKWGARCHSPRQQPRTRTHSWPLGPTEPHCYRPMDAGMPLGGTTSYSHQAILHYPRLFSSTPLHCVHIFLPFFLFCISTTYLLT